MLKKEKDKEEEKEMQKEKERKKEKEKEKGKKKKKEKNDTKLNKKEPKRAPSPAKNKVFHEKSKTVLQLGIFVLVWLCLPLLIYIKPITKLFCKDSHMYKYTSIL